MRRPGTWWRKATAVGVAFATIVPLIALESTRAEAAVGVNLAVAVVAPTEVVAGEPVVAGIDLSNTGTASGAAPAVFVIVSDGRSEPSDLVLAGDGWTCDVGPFAGRVCSRPDGEQLPAGAALPRLDLQLTGPQAPSLTIDAYLWGPVDPDDADAGDNESHVDLPITGASYADLAVTVTATGVPYDAAGLATFEAVVTNVGNTGPPDAVVVDLWAGDPTSASGSGWSCASDLSGATCELSSLAPGATSSPISFSAAVPPGAIEVNGSAYVTSTTQFGIDNDYGEATGLVRQASNAAVTLVAGSARFRTGGPGSYTATVSNVGTADLPGPFQLDLWVDVYDLSFTGAGWTCTSDFGVSCTHDGPLAVGESLPALLIEGTVPDFTDQAWAYVSLSTDGDTYFGDDSVEVSTPVDPGIDLTVGVTSSATSVTVGAPVSFDLTVENVGVQASSGEVRLGWYAPDLDGVVASGVGWTCDEPLRTCTYPDPVAAGSTLPSVTVSGELLAVYDRTLTISGDIDNPSDQLGPNHDLLSLPVVVPVDLVPTISDGGATFVADAPGTYDVVVENRGTQPSSGTINIDLDVPGGFGDVAGTRITSAAGTGWICTADLTSCAHDGPAPPGGQLPTLVVEVVPDGTDAGSTQLTAWLSGGGDGMLGDDYVQELTEVTAATDVTIAIEPAGPFIAGRTGTFTATVANVLPAESTGTVSVNLFVGAAFEWGALTATGTGWTCTTFGRSADCSHPGPVAGGGSLPPITLSGPVSSGFTQVYGQAAVETLGDDLTGDNSAFVYVDIGGETDLSVRIEDPTLVRFGELAEIPVIVGNVRPEDAVGAVELSLYPPTGLTDVVLTSADPDWSCAVDTYPMTCAYPGPVPAGADLAPVVVSGLVGRTWDGVVAVDAVVRAEYDATPDNDHASRTFPAELPVDLSLTVDDAGVSFPITGQGSYTATVTNDGQSATSAPVTVSFFGIASVVTNVVSGSAGWTCSEDASVVTCTTDDAIAPGGTSELLLGFTVGQTSATTLFVTATVDSDEDGRSSNDSDSDQTPLIELLDLAVQIDDADATFTAPGTGRYTVTVANAGEAALDGPVSVVLSATGPVIGATAAGDGWTCTPAGDAVVCDRTATLAAGASLPAISYDVEVDVDLDRSVTGRAEVVATGDAVATNDVSTDSTPVIAPADLVVGLDPGQLVVGRDGTVAVTVENVGSGPTSAQTLVTLDRRGSASGDGWTCSDTDAGLECRHDGVVAAGATLPVLTWMLQPALADRPELRLHAAVANRHDGNHGNDAAQVTAPVSVSVDLTAEITPGRSPFTVARTESYSVVVRNLGVDDAVGPVSLRLNQSSAGLPVVAGDGWDCLTLFGVTDCTHPGPVAAGGTLPAVTTTFEVVVGDYKSHFLSAEVDVADEDAPANDTVFTSVPVAAVDMRVRVEDLGAPAPAPIGERRSYRITPGNVGGLAPPGAVTMTVEPGTGLLQGNVGNDDWACTPDGDAFTCTSTFPVPALGDMPALDVDFYVGGGAYPSTPLTVRMSAPGEGYTFDDAGSVSTTVTGAPDLVIAASPAAGPFQVGTDASVTYTVRNQGAVATTGQILVEAAQQPGFTFLGPDSDVWVCGSDDIGWTCAHPGPVEPGAELPPLTVTFEVGVPAYPGISIATFVDNLSDEDPNNNQVVVQRVVQGIPDIDVTTPITDALAGEVASIPVTVRNVGTAPAVAPTVVETTQFGPGLVPEPAVGTGWSCTPATVGYRCEHPGPVPAGGALPDLLLKAQVSDTEFDGGYRCRFADVGRGLEQVCAEVGIYQSITSITGTLSNPADPRDPNQPLGMAIRVTQPRDLTVTASATQTSYSGDRATIALRVSNVGAQPPTGLVRVSARLDCGYSFTEAGTDQGGCDPGLDDLGVLGPLSVAGDGWACALDALDDKGIVCTRPDLPAGTIPPILVSADTDPTWRGVLVLRPEVATAGDTNPYNDRTNAQIVIDRRRLPTGTSDLTPLAVRDRSVERTVGVNDLFHAYVVNLGEEPTRGTVTVTVTLDDGFSYLRDEADDWACSAQAKTVTCTSDTPLEVWDPIRQAVGGPTFAVGIDAAALPVATHTIEVSYADDPVGTNNAREQVDAVFEGPVPSAVMGVSRTVAPTPSTVDFDASLSQNTGPTTVFRWDFGDGTTAFGEQASHDYTRAGVYTATLRAYTGARYSTDSRRIVIYPDEPLVADAGDDVVVAEGDVVELDGGASRPTLGIQSHRWDFGDGSSATGQSVSHEFMTPGTYQVELTVRIGTLTAVDTVQVVVVPAGQVGDGKGLVIQVDDSSGNPVRLADVTVYDRNGRKYAARADAGGRAVLGTVPSGAYTAYAYRTGYQPGTGRAVVVSGAGSGRVVLKPGSVGEATLEHRRLTLDEIIAAGIDVNDPANQNVVEFTIDLRFAVDPVDPKPVPDLGGIIVNGDGEILEAPDDWLCDPDVCTYDDGDVKITLDGEEDPEAGPTIVALIVPGKARFLKEFFEVTMLVANLGPKGFAFTDGVAALDLPAGLALAPMSEPQALTQPLTPISAGRTGVARWIVRGDAAGEYDLGARYTGRLDPVGSSLLFEAQTTTPLKVWGAEAVNVRVRAQREVRAGRPYRVVVGLENISEVPVYNAGFEFGELGGDDVFTYAPWTDRNPGVGEIAPTTTWWTELWFIPTFNGQLVACNLCEDVTTSPFSTVAGADLPDLLTALATPDGDVDTNLFAPFAAGGASGAPSGAQPSQVQIESVPDDAKAFSAVALPGVDRLSWEQVPGAAAYRVYLDTGSGADPDPVAVLPGDAAGVDLPAVVGDHTYVLGTMVDGTQQLRHPTAPVVTGADQPPTAIDQQVVSDPDVPVVVDVLADEADPEGGPLKVVGVVQPLHGTVDCTAEGVCTYVPEPGYTGPDSFEVTVEDADGNPRTQVVTIVVGEDLDHPPVAVADGATTTAGEPVDIAVLDNDTDADGDPLAISAWSDPDAGSVTCDVGGPCTYSPDAGRAGVDVFTYTIEDGKGGSATAAVRVVVEPVVAGNQAPSAVFDRTVDGGSVDLDGSASSDPDGAIVDHQWDFGDGATGNGPTTTHTYEASGSYEITLTVVDDLGATDTASATVEVSAPAPNVAPTASFHADATALSVAFDGSASFDPDGEVVGYLWQFGDGVDGTGAQAGHTYGAPGTYSVTLTVLDDLGAVGTTTQEVVVVDEEISNQSPTVAFSFDTDELAVSVDGSTSSDPDGEIVAHEWDFGDGSTGSGATATHTYSAPGTYTVTLVVTDDVGATASLAKDVTVVEGPPPNRSPLASFTHSTSELTVAFDGSGSTDPDGSLTDWAWDFGDGSSGNGVTPSHTYARVGAYPVTLVVTDDDGATSRTTRTVVVTTPGSPPPAPQSPVPAFTVTPSGLTVHLDSATSVDPDGTIVERTWFFGDGSTGTGVAPVHAYDDGGTYEITLLVVDDDGLAATVARSVTVVAPPVDLNELPLAAFTVDIDGLTVTVDAGITTDPDGTIVDLSWDFGERTPAGLQGVAAVGAAPAASPHAATVGGAVSSHTYATAGTFAVVLTAVDDRGGTTSLRKTVTVAPDDVDDPVVEDATLDATDPGGSGGAGGADPVADSASPTGQLPYTGIDLTLPMIPVLLLGVLLGLLGWTRLRTRKERS